MKNSILLYLLTILFYFTSYSQVNVGGLGFSYSALVRDSVGHVQPLKAVKLRFTLLLGQTGTTTNSPWIETQSTTTDAYGFVNVTMGNGIKTSGTAATFAAVDFSTANYWILIEVYNTGTLNYDVLNKQALQAVPYAKVAGAIGGSGAVPAGTIVAFAGDLAHVPAGWIWCGGDELDNTDPRYTTLFNAIQYNWGTSNHTNLFRLPYTRGVFLRGCQNGAGTDPDASTRTPVMVGGNGGENVGSFQADAFQGHQHRPFSAQIQQTYEIRGVGNATQIYTSAQGPGVFANNAPNTGNPVNDGTNGDTKMSSETRPKNVYVNYIIKL